MIHQANDLPSASRDAVAAAPLSAAAPHRRSLSGPRHRRTERETRVTARGSCVCFALALCALGWTSACNAVLGVEALKAPRDAGAAPPQLGQASTAQPFPDAASPAQVRDGSVLPDARAADSGHDDPDADASAATQGDAGLDTSGGSAGRDDAANASADRRLVQELQAAGAGGSGPADAGARDDGHPSDAGTAVASSDDMDSAVGQAPAADD